MSRGVQQVYISDDPGAKFHLRHSTITRSHLIMLNYEIYFSVSPVVVVFWRSVLMEPPQHGVMEQGMCNSTGINTIRPELFTDFATCCLWQKYLSFCPVECIGDIEPFTILLARIIQGLVKFFSHKNFSCHESISYIYQKRKSIWTFIIVAMLLLVHVINNLPHP